MRRRSILLCAFTSSTLALPAASRATPCWGTSSAFSSTPACSTARTYMPGSSRPSGLGTTARSVMVPVVGFTFTPLNCSRPGCG